MMTALRTKPPRLLRETRQWLLWRWARRGDDFVKIPTAPDGGGNISAFDERGWMSFDDARDRLRIAHVNNTWGNEGGIGFVLDEPCGIGLIDLDGCRDPKTGKVAGWARQRLAAFGVTYSEISVSGTGFHIIAAGAPEFWSPSSFKMEWAKGDPVIGGKVPMTETFVRKRFFTLSGLALPGSAREVTDCSSAWRRLALDLEARTEKPVKQSRSVPESDSTDLETVKDALSAFSSDDVDRNTFVGFAAVLQEEFGDDARQVFLDWMARSLNDDPDASDALWESAEGGAHSMTLGSLFWHAQQHGWEPPWRDRRRLLDPDDAVDDDFIEFEENDDE